ncbi:MAG: CotH kinase family protein [Planctomycetes bacterium]|nr:CotH kinase family protein [Planctomycetota bacterium]
MLRILSRLWRIPLRYALVVALPLQILVGWIAFQGVLSGEKLLGRKAGFWGSPPPPHIEQWRYFARDAFREDLADLFAPRMPTDDGLEAFSLTVPGHCLASLNADLPKSGKDSGYQPALFETNDARMPVSVRYMGDNHWHWLFPQKSWRIKTKKGAPFRNRSALNLKNPPSRLAISETMITRLSAELGVLTPEVEPIKFMLNGTYGGLYLRWDQADESLLRLKGRMPGSIYQGETGPVGPDGVSSMFREARFWDKVSARNAEQAANRTDIEALIGAINGDPVPFHDFAERHMAFDAYASYIAIDRLFAGRHHDYNHNHKVYFDPYKGRFEPIQWDFGDWGFAYKQKSFDATEYPLLTALKRHPDFEFRLQRKLHELTSWFTPTVMADRLDELVASILPALKADAQRDHRDWPAMRDLQFHLVPCVYFGIDEFLGEAESRKRDFETLHAGVMKDLDDAGCDFDFSRGPTGQLEIAALGHAAQELTALTVRGTGHLELVQDRNRNGRLDAADPVVAEASLEGESTRIAIHELLFPGLRKVPTWNPMPQLYGHFDLAPTPLHYRYFLRCDGSVEDVSSLATKNAVTGSTVEARRVKSLPPSIEPFSTHPWDLPLPPATQFVAFGPGTVEFTSSRRFGPETTVTFAPGTTVKLAPAVSLLCFGKVMAVGREDAPIVFEPLAADKPWGVMLLHGQGTAGSRMSHCRWHGGSIVEHDLMIRSGMVSVIDTRDIVLEHSQIGVNHIGDDAMHWGYVAEVAIRDCIFDGARSDALDIDISEGMVISNCEFKNSGNDCLDLMASRVEVRQCRFTNSGDKGISVGEGSTLTLKDSRFANCVIGVEIKDGSVAALDGSTVIDACGTGINLYRKNERFSRGGTLQADALNIWNSKGKAVTHDSLSTVPANLDAVLHTGGGS